jgi:hypothetical protein
MLDYFGSIRKCEVEIKQEILAFFRSYNDHGVHIHTPCPMGSTPQPFFDDDIVWECYNTLKHESKIDEYTVSGWAVFHYQTTIDALIQRVPEAQQTYNQKLLEAKQRLTFMRTMETYEHAPCRDILDNVGHR